MYQLTTPVNGELRLIIWQEGDRHVSVPVDPANTEYQQYLAWLAQGNQPLPADELPSQQ